MIKLTLDVLASGMSEDTEKLSRRLSRAGVSMVGKDAWPKLYSFLAKDAQREVWEAVKDAAQKKLDKLV